MAASEPPPGLTMPNGQSRAAMPPPPAGLHELQRQLHMQQQALDQREAALAAQEAAVQRQLAEAQALHSRNLGVRASLEAARSAASAAKSALDARVLCAQQLIAELRAAQAAAAATPAAAAVLQEAGIPDVPVPPQAAQQHTKTQQPAGPARLTPERGGPPQPAAAGPAWLAWLAGPQVPTAPAAERKFVGRCGHQADNPPGARTLARSGAKRKPGCEAAVAAADAEEAAAALGDPARAAKRQAAGMAEAAPATSEAPGSPRAPDAAASVSAAAAAAAASTWQSAAPCTTGNDNSAGRVHTLNQQAAAAAPAPPRSQAQPPAGPCNVESQAQHAVHASPTASQQQQLPPLAAWQAPPLPAPRTASLPPVDGSGMPMTAPSPQQRMPPQPSSPKQQHHSPLHMDQQRAQAQQQQQQQQQQRQQGMPPSRQQQGQRRPQAGAGCPKCGAPLQGGHSKKACKAARRLQHTCGRCKQLGHWEFECKVPAKKSDGQQGKHKRRKRDVPQPAREAAAAAGSNQRRGQAQQWTATHGNPRCQAAGGGNRPVIDNDEEGGLDDIVAALQAAQPANAAQPPLQGGHAAGSSGGAHGAEGGAASADEAAAADVAGPALLRRQRLRAPQGSCQAALAALEDDAPELLADLQSHQLVPRLAVLQMPPVPSLPVQTPAAVATTPHGTSAGTCGAAAAAAAAAANGEAFSDVTRALERMLPAPALSALGHTAAWCAPEATLQQRPDHPPASTGGDPADDFSHGGGGGGGSCSGSPRVGRRPLAALETLVDLAEEAAARGEPLLWGWCRQLRAFVFVFEAAHRIVVETPEYGNATYFFELESPMPVAAQVQRLVAVLGARGVTRGALLSDAPLDATGLSDGERAALAAAGWAPGAGLRLLLNFDGERIRHYDVPAGDGGGGSWRQRLTAHLRAGAAGGRVHKEPPCSAAARGGCDS